MKDKPTQALLFKEIGGFLENEILPGIEELSSVINQGLGLKDIRLVSGIPIEWFASLVVDFYPFLSSGFKKKFPKPRLEDSGFLAEFETEIKRFIETKLIKEKEEKEPSLQAELCRIVAQYKLKKKLAARLGKENELRARWRKLIENHNNLILRSLLTPLKELVQEAGLPESVIPHIQKEIKLKLNDGLLGLHQPQSFEGYEELLKQIVSSGINNVLKVTPAGLRKPEEHSLLVKKFSDRFFEINRQNLRLSRSQLDRQRERHNRFMHNFYERARVAAIVTARLNPELVTNPEFLNAFGDWIERVVPSEFTNTQQFAQETQKAVRAAVEKVPQFEALPTEARAKLSQIRGVEEVPKEFFSQPVKTELIKLVKFPVLTTGGARAKEIVKTSLKKVLYVEGEKERRGRWRLPNLNDPILSSLAEAVIERLSEEELVEKIYRTEQQIGKTRSSKAKQALIGLLKTTVRDELVGSFDDLGLKFPPEQKREVLNKISESLFPNQKFALGQFVCEQKAFQNRVATALKEVEASPGLLFTTLLPPVLKPLGFVLDVVSLIPGVKLFIVAGYFGANRKELESLRGFLQSKAISQERKASLLKELYGEGAETSLKAEQRAKNYQNLTNFLNQIIKTTEKPPPLFSSLKDFIRKLFKQERLVPPPEVVSPGVTPAEKLDVKPIPARKALIITETPAIETETEVTPFLAGAKAPGIKPAPTPEVTRTKKPPVLGRISTGLGGAVAKTESFINKLVKKPSASPASFIKDLSRVRVSLSQLGFEQLLDKFSGIFLFLKKPRLFVKTPMLGGEDKPFFKFSLANIFEKTRGFWNITKGFLQRAGSFASGFLNLGVGTLSRLGSFLSPILKALPVFRTPLLAVNLIGNIFSFLRNLIGPGPAGAPAGFTRRGGEPFSFVLSLVSKPQLAIPVLVIASIIFIAFIIPFVGFWGTNVGPRSIALPYQLHQQLTTSSEEGILDFGVSESTQTPTPSFYFSP